MPPHHPAQRRTYFAALATVAATALACGGWGGPAPHEDAPAAPVHIDTVLGTWQDPSGRTIEFFDDRTFVAVGDTFGPGFGHEVPAGVVEGTWRLCSDHRGFHDWDDDAALDTGCSAMVAEGRWIALEDPDEAVEGWIDDLFFTGEGDQLQLYPWFIDVGPDEDDFYTKVD
ncbi:hypothetical protein AB0A73_21515 [Glycomyces sp. NPDC047369]